MKINNQMPAIPYDVSLAMAYIPWQELQEVYEPEAGLRHGTIFPELNKPFTAGGTCCG